MCLPRDFQHSIEGKPRIGSDVRLNRDLIDDTILDQILKRPDPGEVIPLTITLAVVDLTDLQADPLSASRSAPSGRSSALATNLSAAGSQ